RGRLIPWSQVRILAGPAPKALCYSYSCRAKTRTNSSILRTCQRGRALLNQRVELVEINRFYQVMLEPGLLTLTNVLFHPETRESDCHQRLIWGELSYQLDSISIGQSKIADQHIKFLICSKINRTPQIKC